MHCGVHVFDMGLWHVRWREVSNALRLSPEQSKAVVELWHHFIQHVEKLIVERQHIHEQIQATAHDGTCYQTSSSQYLQASHESCMLPCRITVGCHAQTQRESRCCLCFLRLVIAVHATCLQCKKANSLQGCVGINEWNDMTLQAWLLVLFVLEGDLGLPNLQAHELMEQLKKNLREEHVVIHQFLVEWYTKVCFADAKIPLRVLFSRMLCVALLHSHY